MLTQEDLATVRAALRFWRDEMIPVGGNTSQYYFDGEQRHLLTCDEVDALVERFQCEEVRYLMVEDGQPISALLDQPALAVNTREFCVTVIRHRTDEG
jgi:hypothetical protein